MNSTSGLPFSVSAGPSTVAKYEPMLWMDVTALLVLASGEDFDVLFTDVQMPGMTGLQLHRHLIDAGYAIPTIVVTAYPDEVVRRSALNGGVVCYLCKPVDDEHLERCLRSALESGKPLQENS